jgi:hypothetical protein
VASAEAGDQLAFAWPDRRSQATGAVGELAEWLRQRCRLRLFTTRGLTAELVARGIKTDHRAVRL